MPFDGIFSGVFRRNKGRGIERKGRKPAVMAEADLCGERTVP
jgi:hypothetical protein